MTPGAAALVAAGAAFGAGLFVTPKVRALAQRLKLVATPTADRWHREPTALMGGVAILAATVVGVGVWLALRGSVSFEPFPIAAVGVCAAFMFVVGLVDGGVRLRAQLKFILQMLAGVGLVAAGATVMSHESSLFVVVGLGVLGWDAYRFRTDPEFRKAVMFTRFLRAGSRSSTACSPASSGRSSKRARSTSISVSILRRFDSSVGRRASRSIFGSSSRAAH